MSNVAKTTNNQVASKPKFSQVIQQDNIQKLMLETLGDRNQVRTFVGAISSAVATNPTLQECTPFSILNGALTGETLKLAHSPQMGHYYLVPYNNNKNKTKEAQFQIGYKGYIQLAIRSGQYTIINTLAIKEGEEIKYNRLTEEFVFVKEIEDDREREKAATIGYVAVLKLVNGFTKVIYWTKEKMEEHANKYSTAFNLQAYNNIKAGKVPHADMWKYSSYWYKDFDGMALKTMLRQLISKWGIMTIEMQTAFERDMSVIDEGGSYRYVDNEVETGSSREIIDQGEVNVSEEITVNEDTGEVVEEVINANDL